MTQQWLASVQQCTGDKCEPRGRVKLWLTMCTMLHVQTACTMPSTMRHSAYHNGYNAIGSSVTMDKR
eukprot:4167054-Amphidinium_carterae.1